MAKFKVWNKNTLVHREQFKGDEIVIQPGKFVLMEEDDAILFKGQFQPIRRGGDNQPLPESFKMIMIEPHTGEAVIEETKVPEHVCQACKYKGASEADLSEHIKANHKDALVVDKAAEEANKSRKKAG